MLALRAMVIVMMVTGLMSTAGSSGDAVSRPAGRARGCTIVVTGYNSTVRQTDSTPFVTASQTRTRWGVVGANWLPIGTKVRMKVQLSGRLVTQEFVVEDRMHPRHGCKMDVWFAEEKDADDWGIRNVFVSVLAPQEFQCPSQPETVKHKCPEPS